MKREGLYEKHAYQILLTLLPTLASMLFLNDILKLDLNNMILGIMILLLIVFVRILDYNKSYVVVRIGLVCLTAIVLGIIVYNITPLYELKDKLQWIVEDKVPHKTLEIQEQLIIDLLLVLCTSIPLYVIQKGRKIRTLFAAILLIVLICSATLGKMLPLFAIALSFVYIFLVLGERLVARYLTYIKIDLSKVMLHLAPLLLLYLIIIANVPVSDKPVKVHETIITTVKSTVTEWYRDIRHWLAPDGGVFEVAMQGYSEDTGFGGVKQGKDVVSLQVSSQRPLGQRLYLRGNWKNIYTGRNWEESLESTDIYQTYPEDKMDWAELMYAMYRYDKCNSFEELVAIDSMDILYKDIETSSLFLPLKSTYIRANMVLDTETPENLNFKDLMRDGNRYYFASLKLNYLSDRWKSFVSQEQQYKYSSVNLVDVQDYREQIQSHGTSIGLDCYFNNEDIFRKRAEYIKSQFTNLPDDLPKRVAELSQDITKDCKTPIEKCNAIEAYLESYRYTMQPKQVSKGEDLVDGFLFDTREGYCTYFASAMAVMVRTLGIPSRYVQGFAVGTGVNRNSKYNVKSSSAHAWVEVYIEGIGWLTYDPTPASGTGLAEGYRWDTKNVVPNTPSDILIDGGAYLDQENRSRNEDMAKYNEDLKLEDANKLELLKLLLLIISVMIVLGIVLVILYVSIRILRNRRAVKNKSPNEILHLTMAQIFYLLGELIRPIDSTETMHQYFSRISIDCMEYDVSLDRVEPIYTSGRYSNQEIKQEDVKRVIECRQNLLFQIRKKENRYQYWVFWLKYSLMVF